jgi:hypothetical protein
MYDMIVAQASIFAVGVTESLTHTDDKILAFNTQSVLDQIKIGNVEKIAIVLGSEEDSGQDLAEKIHTQNPYIPILVINGRNFNPECAGTYSPVTHGNEFYCDSGDSSLVNTFFEDWFKTDEMQALSYKGHDTVSY